MLDELGWAKADLEHAKTLYEQVMASGQPRNETWQSQGYRWHFGAWQDMRRTPTLGSPAAVTPGLWNASLAATSPTASWSFSWSGDGWFAV
jgi:hypothetical protein